MRISAMLLSAMFALQTNSTLAADDDCQRTTVNISVVYRTSSTSSERLFQKKKELEDKIDAFSNKIEKMPLNLSL